jgi:hypothetical protein
MTRVNVDRMHQWVRQFSNGETCYPNSLTVVFPSSSNACPNCDEAIDKIRKAMNENFKGSTEWDSDGCWWDDDNKKVVCEKGKVLWGANQCFNRDKAEKVGNAIIEATQMAYQSAVFVGTGNTVHIIDKKYFKDKNE